MFQDRAREHVGRFGTGITPTQAFAATPQVTNQNAIQSRRNGVFGRLAAAGVAANFAGWSVGVVDGLGVKSACILSYSFALEAALSAAGGWSVIMPFLYDKQAAAVTGAGVAIPVVNATDVAFLQCDSYMSDASSVHVSVVGKGSVLVNPFLESATGGITVREFGLGIMIKTPSVAVADGFISLELKLYDQELPFFQPSK